MFDKVIHIPPMDNASLAKIANEVTPDPVTAGKLVRMANGNIGAMTVIQRMFEFSPERATYAIGKCANWNISGSMLWLLYKDVNQQDVADMIAMIEKEEAPDALEALPYAHYERSVQS